MRIITVDVSDAGGEDIKVRFQTGGYDCEKTIEFDGYPDTAKDIQDFILGQVARAVNLELQLKRLLNKDKEA